MNQWENRHFLSLHDYTADEIAALLDLAAVLKKEKKNGACKPRMTGKNIALIFEKPSTRTRCAFAVACADMGAHSDYLGKNDIQLGYKESVEDTARVLGRMYDGIEFRGFKHAHVEALAKYSGVPVWNGLTDDEHPTQALADLLTIQEAFGELRGVKLAYYGDGRNNVANTLMMTCAKMGMYYVCCSPKDLFPDEALVARCEAYAAESGGTVTITDRVENVVGADVVYTDVWCSMGEEDKSAERVKLLKPYQVNAAVMALASKRAILLHCLPAVKGNEVTEDVFEQHAKTIFDEAENRLHTIKAVMVASLYGIEG